MSYTPGECGVCVFVGACDGGEGALGACRFGSVALGQGLRRPRNKKVPRVSRVNDERAHHDMERLGGVQELVTWKAPCTGTRLRPCNQDTLSVCDRTWEEVMKGAL